MIQFESPLWLAGLLLSAYAFWSWWTRAPRSSKVVPVFRALAVACLTLALAGATWMRAVPGIDLHVLVDRSASVDGESQAKAEAFIQELSRLLGPSDRIALYSFGRDVQVELPLSGSVARQAFQSVPDATATDIEAALRAALLRADPRANSRIVLLSDGIQTVGDAESVAAAARTLRTPIDVYPLSPVSAGEVAIEHLIVPEAVAPDEPYAVRAVVSSTEVTRAHLSLYRDGEFVVSGQYDVQPGRNVITLAELREPPAAAGSAYFEARLVAEPDRFRENNVARAIVGRVFAAPVLVLASDAEGAEALRLSLETQGLTVDVAAIADAPLDLPSLIGYRAVVLHNVPAGALTPRQLANLESYVENSGGGLLVTGGLQSFGLGGYERTALERILPVAMDAPQSVIMPSLAMILVLDRSGSMAETQGAFSKLDLAKEAALGVLDVINDNDLLGIIAFDSQARWVVPLQTVANRIAFAASIASLSPEGGTNLEPALQLAAAGIRAAEAAVKHVIVLTDGRSTPADFARLTADLVAGGASLSTVGIGRDADRELLEQMAGWGSGRFYYTEDIHAIPQIFATETMMVSRPIRVDHPFTPVWDQRADFWFDYGELPELGGYVITTPKAAAAVHLRAPDGSPVLATWRYGLGRTAAFTSSLSGSWAGEWPVWNGAPAFWGQLVRWLMKPTPTSGLLPELAVEDGTGRIVVDALDPEGRYLNFLDLVGVVHTPDGGQYPVQLEQIGPGRYEGSFPAREEGPYTVTVYAERRDEGAEPVEPAAAGAVVSYPEEFRITSPDPSLLYRLAWATGGLIVRDDPRALFDHPNPARRPRPLAPWLVAFAFALFFADVVLRYAPGRGIGVAVRARLGRASGAQGALASPEEELKRRREEHQRALEQGPMASSSVDQASRHLGAGRYLASRTKVVGSGRGEDSEDREGGAAASGER